MAPRDPSATQVRIALDLSPSVGAADSIVCEVTDTGEFAVPADLLAQLAELGIAGFPTLHITRLNKSFVQTSAGRVELRISSSREVRLGFTDLQSCADTAEFCDYVPFVVCPEAPHSCPWNGLQVCRADRFCEPPMPEATRTLPTEPPNYRGLLAPSPAPTGRRQWWQ
jgi:hypothetical protein